MGSMFRETSLGKAISASAYREQRDHYDRICKRILSEKIILGWILHECLREYRDVTPDEIAATLIEGTPTVSHHPVHGDDSLPELIAGANSEDTSIAEGTVWFDIRFEVLLPHSDDAVGVIVNIEAQGDFFPGYPLLKRATYYCARMISSQYGRTFTDSHYEHLQKVFSIWICPNPPRAYRNTITRYALAETNVIGSALSPTSEYDLIEMLLVCPDGDRQKPGGGILRLLGTLIGSEQSADVRKEVISKEFGISLSKELSDEVDEMSNVSKGILEHGVKVGFERGEQAGFERGEQAGYERGEQAGFERGERAGYERGERAGFERGEQAATVMYIKSLMATEGKSAEAAMDALGIDEQDRQEYRDLL